MSSVQNMMSPLTEGMVPQQSHITLFFYLSISNLIHFLVLKRIQSLSKVRLEFRIDTTNQVVTII